MNYENKNDIVNILGSFLNKTISDKNYLIVENNVLDGEIIVNKGDILTASNISSTNRNLGEYSFNLSVF